MFASTGNNRPIADCQNKIFLTQRTQRAQSSTLLIAPTAQLTSFCRVGIAHHHGLSKGCILSGNARPTSTAQLTRKKAFSVPSVFSVTKRFFERALMAENARSTKINEGPLRATFYCQRNLF